ncbi:MAG: peptide ABC transporter substrate-binding protein [Actinomycetota bacterium]|nr:peptide ABC transporter substrate-binding protein [Actinomycetota bacterium]
MRKRSFWIALAALTAVVTMTATGATAGSPQGALKPAAVGGTVILGADQEPKILNPFLTDGNLYWLSVIVGQVFEGSFEINNKGVYVKEMITSATVTSNPFTVTYKLKPGLKWSDGKAITSKDYVSTKNTIMNMAYDITSRAGYEDIARIQTPNALTARVVFKKPFAAWKDLFGGLIPAHKVAGKDFNKTWTDSIDISSGPFKFQKWDRGSQLVLTKNANYNSGAKSKINQLVFRFIPDTNTQFQAMRGGEVDMIAPQPQLQIADIKKQAGIRVQSGPEFAWEHLDIQLGNKGHLALRQPFVRQALVTGINRGQIANALYREIAPGLPVLNNVVYKPFQKEYAAHRWQPFGFSQKKAISLLRAKGCTGGPAVPSSRNKDIYSCPGVGKLSFRFFSTAGNQLRSLAFQIMQKQLLSIGIDLENRFRTGVFSVLPTGDWDLFLFTWIGSPDPGGSVEIHKCKGDQNYNAYCNAKASRLLALSQNQVDPARRTALLNEADRLMSRDLPTLPLFARPGFLIHKSSVGGVLKNPTSEGPTWNSEVWTVAR